MGPQEKWPVERFTTYVAYMAFLALLAIGIAATAAAVLVVVVFATAGRVFIRDDTFGM